MFIAALSTIAKLWKEPNCPSTDECIKKMWLMYTMEYYMAMRKNEIIPFPATWMELEDIMLSEVSQRKISYVFTHMWNLRNLTEDHGGRERGKNSFEQRGRETNHSRLLNTENKLRV